MAKTNDAFSALSLKDRAELLNIYVKGGMMDLKEIKDHYNSLYEEKEPNKYGWGGASKEALGKAFGDASSAASSVTGIAGSAMTMVSNGMENAEINTTEADNAIEAVESYKLDNSSLDALANSYNATPWAATDYDSSDFTKSGWEIAGNTFESTLSGITTGASVGGPWGAVIGGLAGLGSGLIGWGIGEAKAEEAERRLEAQAKKANRAIELNAVNTRDSILQQQTNNTLRNIAADGGRLNKFDGGGYTESQLQQATDNANKYFKKWYQNPERKKRGLTAFYNKSVDEYKPTIDYNIGYIVRDGDNLFYDRYISEDTSDVNRTPILKHVKAPTNYKYTGEYIEVPGSTGIKVSNPFYNDLFLSEAKAKLQEFTSDDNLTKLSTKFAELPSNIGGQYSPTYGDTVHINKNVSIPIQDIITHEGSHRLSNTFDKDGNNIENAKYLMPDTPNLIPVKKTSFYYDDPDEILARLNNIRHVAGINPDKIMTKEDINNIRNAYYNGKLNTSNINIVELLDRYDTESLLKLFNNTFNDGGRILDGDEKEQTLSGKPWYQLDPKRIVKNVPAREWGPYELEDNGSGTYKRGTRFIDAYRNYKDDKHEYGKQNEIVVNETLKKGDKNEKYYEDAIAYKNHLEALKKYLKLPYDESYIAESEHQPTKSIGTDDVYYRFTNQTPDYWSDVVDDMLLRERNEKQYLDPTLNTFTAYRDRDDKGDFISIYDTWDYSPTVVGGSKKMNKIIDTFTGGKGFDIYDRIYLDDYFGVPEEAKGNAFITPVIVQGVKKDTEQMLKSLGIPKEKWNEYLDKEYKSGGKLKKVK